MKKNNELETYIREVINSISENSEKKELVNDLILNLYNDNSHDKVLSEECIKKILELYISK